MSKSSISINGKKVIVEDNKVIVEGVEYKKPGFGYSLSVMNGDVYVNGYRLSNGKWIKKGFFGWLKSLI